jgi:hypothetical protein
MLRRLALRTFTVLSIALSAFPGQAADWSLFAGFFGEQCPDNLNIVSDREGTYKALLEILNAKGNVEVSTKISEKLAQDYERDIKTTS